MPPCPRCGEVSDRAINFCASCGSDLRGIGGETDTLVGSFLGRVIDGRYRVLQKLGEGGMGSVYKVEHVRMGKICGLKVLRPDLLQGPQGRALRERFREEARIVSRLVHVNTIQVFDFGETEEGELYLAMEYLRGRSLAEVRRDEGGRLSERRVSAIAVQVLRSLAEAHEAGIVHRDIKPQNVMLLDQRDRKDFVKVLDFGIAKLTLASGDQGRKTGAGELVGTPNYISPEQARGRAPDGRSDLYSLGAMMFELLTGRAPYEAETPLGVVTAHLTEPVPDARELDPAISPGMDAIIRQAMAKDPEARFPHADAMRAALDADRRAEAPPSGHARLPTPVANETAEALVAVRADFERYARRLALRRTLSALVPLVLLAAGAGGLWAWSQQAPAPLSAEVEPNDDPGRATPFVPERILDPAILRARMTTAGGPGEPAPLRVMEGYLGRRVSKTQGDLDWYRLELGSPGELLLELGGVPNIDLVLEVLAERTEAPGKLRVLARSDVRGRGAFEALPNLPVLPGTYYVQVRQVQVVEPDGSLPLPVENVSDPYRLSAVLRAPLQEGEREPNDQPSEATVLEPGRLRRGFVGVAGHEDWWRVAPFPGGPLSISVSAVPQARLQVELWDGKGIAGRSEGKGRPLETQTGRFGEAISIGAKRMARDDVWVVVRTLEGSNHLEPYELRTEPP